MAGLLGTHDRTCRYGHGALQLMDGWYALTGVNRGQSWPSMSSVAQTLFPRTSTPNNTFMTLKVYRCSTCGYVELADEE